MKANYFMQLMCANIENYLSPLKLLLERDKEY